MEAEWDSGEPHRREPSVQTDSHPQLLLNDDKSGNKVTQRKERNCLVWSMITSIGIMEAKEDVGGILNFSQQGRLASSLMMHIKLD